MILRTAGSLRDATRLACFSSIAAAALLLAGATFAAAAFDLDDVATRARELASRSFEEPSGQVPRWLLEIGYDEWREIRFRPERALWRGSGIPFEVQFFHPGLFYDRTVALHEVDAEGVHPISFSPSQFDYGTNKFGSEVPQDIGYAGFRLHYPIKRPDYNDEVIVFLGASYFRALGRDQVFGLSARGLAVDTASPGGEEFPYFKEFWLIRPARSAGEIVVYALLDSRRVTGAYRFVVYPGVQTIVDVEARLFARESIDKVGIAPLTSMFFSGENTLAPVEDYRPEVHDSDGLLLQSGAGEWIWRPLDNPRRLRTSAFLLPHPKGFGLIQRDRGFDHYQDLETRQDLRPSVWIEPKGDWGAGRVELVEIPTQDDTNDNVVAYWVFDDGPAAEKPVALAYRMVWLGEDGARPPGGRAVATRRDRGTYEDAHRFVVDFDGKSLQKIPADRVLRGVLTAGAKGEPSADNILEQQVQKNPVTGGWRMTFQIKAPEDEPLELRAFLQEGENTLTETWTYVIEP